MATNVILPALGISQDTGKILRWLRAEGQTVTQGEPLLEIETDKAAVELEAPASGILANISANEGDETPVGQVIAVILAPGEPAPQRVTPLKQTAMPVAGAAATTAPISATPVATRMAQEHGVDLQLVKPQGSRIEMADVLAYLEMQKAAQAPTRTGRIAASPKARRRKWADRLARKSAKTLRSQNHIY